QADGGRAGRKPNHRRKPHAERPPPPKPTSAAKKEKLPNRDPVGSISFPAGDENIHKNGKNVHLIGILPNPRHANPVSRKTSSCQTGVTPNRRWSAGGLPAGRTGDGFLPPGRTPFRRKTDPAS